MRRFPVLLWVLTGLLTTSVANRVLAAEVSVEAAVEKKEITMDDQLPLTITITGSADVSDPQLPILPSFEIYSSGRAQNVSIINGTTSSSTQFTYLLVPKSPGHITIPPIQVKAGGKQLFTQAIEITVQSGSGVGQGGGAAPQVPAIDTHEPTEGIMLRAKVNKKHVVVQEQVILTIQFLRRVRFITRPNYTPPDTTGWMSYDLPPGDYTTTINGLGYTVTELKYALFPTSSGTLTIGPAAIQCTVENLQADPFDSMFENLFQSGQMKTLKTRSLNVEVAPLPESGKPEGFSGSVGRYTFKGDLDKSSIKAGEPVTLTFEAAGEGNIKTMGEPVLTLPPGFRRYETVTSLNFHNHGDKVAGSKVFKIVVVPEQSGTFSIPPAKFSYYDPDAKKYITLESAALKLTIAPGAETPRIQAPVTALPQGGEVRLLQNDIHYLKTALSNPPPIDETGQLKLFAVLNGIPLLLAGGAFWARSQRDRELQDPLRARSRRALSQAKHRMKGSSSLGVQSSALSGYIADKLGLAGSGLSLEEAAERLRTQGVPEDDLQTLKKLWEEIDRGRFTPVETTDEEKKKTHSQTLALLARLEKRLR